jgi:hypothetical protein
MTCAVTGRYTGLGLGGALISMPMTSGTPYPDRARDPSQRPTVLDLDGSGSAGLALAPPPMGQESEILLGGPQQYTSAGSVSRKGCGPRTTSPFSRKRTHPASRMTVPSPFR